MLTGSAGAAQQLYKSNAASTPGGAEGGGLAKTFLILAVHLYKQVFPFFQKRFVFDVFSALESVLDPPGWSPGHPGSI